MDIGKRPSSVPVTPPCVRVRTRRFCGLSYRPARRRGKPRASKAALGNKRWRPRVAHLKVIMKVIMENPGGEPQRRRNGTGQPMPRQAGKSGEWGCAPHPPWRRSQALGTLSRAVGRVKRPERGMAFGVRGAISLQASAVRLERGGPEFLVLQPAVATD